MSQLPMDPAIIPGSWVLAGLLGILIFAGCGAEMENPAVVAVGVSLGLAFIASGAVIAVVPAVLHRIRG